MVAVCLLSTTHWRRASPTPTIKESKDQRWYDWLDDMTEWSCERNVWKANNLYINKANSDPNSTRIPTMKEDAPGSIANIADNAAKNELFQRAFFIPLPVNMPDLPNDYPDPVFECQPSQTSSYAKLSTA
ncbi:hypothetical protein QCA50_018035 [Cerrena zonata]|uniref:Uncharacterized protein n=1 Tax=Cerrena zonata TaxID=2478898 RepID=A0AAW0FQ93_9APHY